MRRGKEAPPTAMWKDDWSLPPNEDWGEVIIFTLFALTIMVGIPLAVFAGLVYTLVGWLS